MFGLRKVAMGAAVMGALSATALGFGAASAQAAPGAPWPQDRGWEWDDGRLQWQGDRGHHRGWDNGPGPQVHINLPCVTGPLGYVTVCP